MNAYQPVDLTAVCNAGVDALAGADVGFRAPYQLPWDPAAFPRGAVRLRGLPFLVGGERGAAERCLVRVEPGGAPVFVPLAAPGAVAVRRVIVAHRQPGVTSVADLDAGAVVATYVFRLEDGSTWPVPIRARLEVMGDPAEMLLAPLAAEHDLGPRPFPYADEGPYDFAGMAQMAVRGPAFAHWWLWSWVNPRPDVAVAAMEVLPGASPLLIAAVTVSRVEERPFAHEGGLKVRIDFDGAEVLPEVSVDRGLAARPQPLASDGLVGDPGWGRPRVEDPAVVSTTVAATPSATLSVEAGDRRGSVRWRDVLSDGEAADGPVRVRLVERGRSWVHVTVVDDGTGRPVPCRVAFRSITGVPYQPHGHHDEVALNQGSWHRDVGGDVRIGHDTYAYIDGRCQGWLPHGEVVVDVARGFEYTPLREVVRIRPGQRELELRLRRFADPAAQGWYSGDSHVHFLSVDGGHLEAAGEGLHVVNLLASQWGRLFTNVEDFNGRASVHPEFGTVVFVGQENRQHRLGHLSLLGLRRPVTPWCADGPIEGELGGTLETTLSHWADAAREQGALVVIPHYPIPNGETDVLVATGRADAVEFMEQEAWAHHAWYARLNAGYRIPLVGGTDKMDGDVPVGLNRTYVQLDRELSHEAWCRGVSAGRTFVSSGPLLSLSVDGVGIGGTVTLRGPGTVTVRATAESALPIHALQIVVGGDVVAAVRAEAGARRLTLEEDVRLPGPSWLAARVGGRDYWDAHPYATGVHRAYAHTSPVYVVCGGQERPGDPDVLRHMLAMAEGGLRYSGEIAARRDRFPVTHHHGETDHLAYLQRPFHEAVAALRARLGEGATATPRHPGGNDVG